MGRFQNLGNNILKLTVRIIKNITSLCIPFQNLKYIINIYNPYVFLYTTNSYRNMSLKKEDKERKEKMTSNPPSQDIASTDSADSNQTTKPAEEREVVVVKPSKTEYKESDRTDNSSSAEEKEREQSVSAAAKVKEAGQSFKEMIKSLGKKAMTKTEEKTKQLKDKSAAETVDTSPQKDAKDIQALGTHAENVVLVFEKAIAEIGREDYESQEKLLAGYKKLLEEQINVIDSKQRIAKRLKGISK